MRNSVMCVAYLCFPVALKKRIHATMHVSTRPMSPVFIAYVSSSYNSRYLFRIKAFSCCMSRCACGFQHLIMTAGIATYSWARVSTIVFSCVKEGSVAAKASRFCIVGSVFATSSIQQFSRLQMPLYVIN